MMIDDLGLYTPSEAAKMLGASVTKGKLLTVLLVHKERADG